MTRLVHLSLLAWVLSVPLTAADGNRVILDETSVKNLHLETVETEETDFEETIFSLGQLEVLPGRRAVVSSRIPGRAFSVLALPDQQVEEGDELAWVESRQPGDPPPTIMLPAPMAGLISKVDIAPGQPITPDQALIEIIDLETLEAAAQVPEHLAGRLEKGQTARIRLPAFPDKTFEAKLAHIGAYADAQNGTVEAAFHLPNEDLLLRPGMRAEFSIVISRRENVSVIPRSALQGDGINRFVFVKDFELPNAFVKAPVVIGQTNDVFVEILSGLLPGDEVVTQGAYALAFAGGGTTSLKEALDAAHGHEHNEDGTEKAASTEGTHDHDHDHDDSPWNQLTLLFAASTALLLALLIIQSLRRKEVVS
jgi:cobalt-zinc-cadmium efflux system membrane fusion protein